jgi:RNA 2',3'-cyclic 3'-phosphodiesterase
MKTSLAPRNAAGPAPATAIPDPGVEQSMQPRLRLFLALWPNPEALQGLRAWADTWIWPEGVARIGAQRWHLTLHFIGDVPATRLDEFETGLAVPCPRIELEFGRAQQWSGGLALAVPEAVPPALTDLHGRLGDALVRLGAPVDTRRYKPHVTLARHAEAAVPPAAPLSLRWVASGYALVVSDRGYRTLRRYRGEG